MTHCVAADLQKRLRINLLKVSWEAYKMTQGWKYRYRLLVLIGSLAIPGLNLLLPMGRALTQTVPDRTLGAESSIVTHYPGGVDVILGGATRGGNLFHSFAQFSVVTGGAAYFNNAVSIQNIISRVTGSSVSNINGLIAANGKANLFLINPNGIVFGPNASLNIGGSFVASTASSLKFADGTEFSATNPQTTPLLTISVPIGLQFGANPGSITNQSRATDSNGNTVGLRLLSGQTLVLVGGDVNFNNGTLQAPGGRVELGGLAGAGTVGLNIDNASHLENLSFPNGLTRANVSLTNGSEVNVRAGGGGSIAINAQNLNVSGGSNLRAGIASGMGSLDSKAGDININATETLTMTDVSLISNAVIPQATGDGGDINITTKSLSLTGGSQINSSTFGRGNAGNVNINASNITFSGTGFTNPEPGVARTSRASGASSNGDYASVGNGGSVNIKADSLSLIDGAQIQTLIRGASNTLPGGNGTAGNVNINVHGTFTADGVSKDGFSSLVSSSLGSGAMGKAGDVNVTAGSLSVTNGAELDTSTYGKGDAGSVTINTSGLASFDGVGSNGFSSGAFSEVEKTGVGKGGDVNVTAGSLSVTNGAELDTSTYGKGDAGSVTINTSGLALTGSALIQSTTFGNGNAGNVNIETNSIQASGADINLSTGLPVASGIRSNVETGAVGNGGIISIKASSLSLIYGAQIAALVRGQGNGGNINIDASNITFSGVSNGNTSGVLSNIEAGGIGNGGVININANSLSLTDGGQIQTILRQASDNNLPGGRGKAGSVNIDAHNTLTLTGESNDSNRFPSAVFSSVGTGALGNGGSINVKTGSLSVTNGAQLDAATFGRGNAGSVTITASGLVSFDGVGSNGNSSGAFSTVNSGAIGKGGGINVTAGSLSVTNGAVLNSSTYGKGDAGNVFVQTNNFVFLTNSSAIASNVIGGVGNGGDVSITAGSLSLNNTALLATSTLGRGNAGNIRVNATDSVSVRGGSSLAASTFGQGNAGSVTIEGRDGLVPVVSFNGMGVNGFPSSVFTAVDLRSTGKGGDIAISSSSLYVSNGAQLITSTLGQNLGQDAGNIRVNATDSISLSGGSLLRAETDGQANAGSIFVHANDSVFLNSSQITSVVGVGAVGKGGDINVTAGSLALTNGAVLNSSTFGNGNAGSILVQANGLVSLANANIFSTVDSKAVGNSGDIKVTAGSLSLTNGAQLDAATFGRGDAGSVMITASGLVSFDGVGPTGFSSGAFSAVASTGNGKGGNVNVTAGSLSLTSGAQLSASTYGNGDAGSITINTSGLASFDGVSSNGFFSGAFSSVNPSAVGKGGGVNITASSLSLTNGAELSATTGGNGDAGSVTINSSGPVSFDKNSGAFSQVNQGAMGKGGDVNVTASSLSLTNGAQLTASTFGTGDAGSVTINTSGLTSFDGIGSNGVSSGALSAVASTGNGKGGNVNVTASSLSLTSGAQLAASTSGQGDAGSVTINTSGLTSFDGVGSNGFSSGAFSTVNFGAMGKGGGVNVTAGSLSLTNGAGIATSTKGLGNAGSIFVHAQDSVSLTNSSVIDSSVLPGGRGNGGNIDIQARSLLATNGSQVGAILFRQGTLPGGQGVGGNIQVNASDFVTLTGIGATGFSSGLLADSERGAVGPAGSITVSTSKFRVADGAIVAASTLNSGNGGDITINAKTFEAVNGGQVLTNTRNSGKAGNITLNVTDSITLSGSDPNYQARLTQIAQRLQAPGQTDQVSDVVGNEGSASGLFANTARGSTGAGGSISIDPNQLSITNGATVAVSSLGQGKAGNLQIQAGTLTLDQGSSIIATTASTEGGNINLKAQDLLLLRHGSDISATAGTVQAGGNGGNITITTPFVIAVPQESSHISANAFKGNGGSVAINASGIFGTQFQKQPTSLSDITASSTGGGINGVVNINTPVINPSYGVATLPAIPINVNTLIANTCIAGRHRQGGSFIVTGSGGLPTRPGDALVSPYSTGSIRSLPGNGTATNDAPEAVTAMSPSTSTTASAIVPATGWVFNNKGQVLLTAQAPSTPLEIPWLAHTTCHVN